MREKRKRERGKDERKEEHEKFMKKSDGNFNFKSGARVKNIHHSFIKVWA